MKSLKATFAAACLLIAGGAVAQTSLVPVAGPARAPVAPKIEPSLPGVHELTKADLDTWLDGYLPYALRTGDIPGLAMPMSPNARRSIRSTRCSASDRCRNCSPGPQLCNWSTSTSSTSTPM